MSGVIKAGRPRVITEVEVIMLEHALRHDKGVLAACRYAGIGRTTYYDELERNEAFANRMDYAKRWLGMQAKKIVADAILVDRNVKMSQWFLAHREPSYRC